MEFPVKHIIALLALAAVVHRTTSRLTNKSGFKVPIELLKAGCNVDKRMKCFPGNFCLYNLRHNVAFCTIIIITFIFFCHRFQHIIQIYLIGFSLINVLVPSICHG